MNYQDLKNICDDIYVSNFEPFLCGRRDLYMGLMAAYLARGHVLVEGPPGTAKTLTAKLIAKTFSRSFKRIQFTDDLLPKQILGYHYWHQGRNEYRFMAGPLFTEIILADEINRAPPRTQSAFLEAMEERQLTVEGNTLELGENFFVVATQNPSDYAGTHPLPEVQLDRFLFSFGLKYASLSEEVQIVQKHLEGKLPPHLNSLKTLELNMTEVVPMLLAVKVEESVISYAASIIRATRNNPDFEKGASLRAILGIVKGAQVYAALEGRDHVIFADIDSLAVPSLRHRITLSEIAKKEGRDIEALIREIVSNQQQLKAA